MEKVEFDLREVELRHPHKAKRLTDEIGQMNSTINLADDYYRDDDSDLSSELGKKVGPTVWDHILLNRPVKVVLAMLIAVLVVPTLLYGFMYGLAPDPQPFGSCTILNNYRSECMPGLSPLEKECIDSGCCWNATSRLCFHTLPARHNYRLKGETLTPRLVRSPLGGEALPLKVEGGVLSSSHALVQLSVEGTSAALEFVDDANALVEVLIREGEAMWVEVIRTDVNRTMLFSTDIGPLVATDGFWEWSLQFPEENVLLGAGASSRRALKLGGGSVALYQGQLPHTSGRPFILSISETGEAYGVLIKSEGALEIVTRPSNLVSVRTTAGAAASLQVHTFVGADPSEVFDALTNYTGRPPLPPYWALGLHICRDAARESATNASLVFRKEAAALELPFDSDCVDDTALGNATFTIEQGRLDALLEAAEALSQDERHLLLSVFGQVAVGTAAFAEAHEANLLLSSPRGGGPFLGQHHGLRVGYPDYRNPGTATWLLSHLNSTLWALNSLLPSGLLLPDNWPLNEESQGDGQNEPHYVPQALEGSMSNWTVLWNAKGADGIQHQDVHNTYGATHSAAVQQAFSAILEEQGLTPARIPLLSASNWVGGSTGGWLGEEHVADWSGLKGALLSVLEAGMSGEPFSGGGAICGASGNWTASLCTRWSLLALSTFPLARYHYRWGEPGRDPTHMDESSARIVARAARLRYELMPYFYTHMRLASNTGMPLVRPMAIDFASDKETWKLDEQFMVGPALMAAPVLTPDAVSLTLHLPNGSWYHLQGGERVLADDNKVTLLAPENELILLIRGGHVIPMQDAGNSSQLSRANLRHVIAALDCADANRFNCTAQGRLELDDGRSPDSVWDEILFSADSISFTVEGVATLCNDPTLSTTISALSVYGLPGIMPPNSTIMVNGVEAPEVEVKFDHELGRLQLSNLSVDWCLANSAIVEWRLDVPA